MPPAKQIPSNALLETVRPTGEDGPLLGMAISTYSLSLENPDFFSQDFLPTVFGLGGVRQRGYASPATLERALSLADVALVCDAHAVAEGARPSLRIDVIPVGDRVHHAKIHLLHWQQRVRLIVGSANLTHEGFRRQREAAVVLDFYPGGPLPVRLLSEACSGWAIALGKWYTPQLRRIVERAVAEAHSWHHITHWQGDFKVVFGGGPRPLWEELVSAWPAGEPVSDWHVCSPFWPSPAQTGGDTPFEAIAQGLLRKKSLLHDCRMTLIARADTPSPRALPLFPFALIERLRQSGFPVRRGQILPARLPTTDEEVAGGVAPDNRELHGKWVVLAGPRSTVALIGSANFTRRGMGTTSRAEMANIEAGVLARFSRARWRPEEWRPPILGQVVEWATCGPTELCQPPLEEDKRLPWPQFVRSIDLEIHWGQEVAPPGRLEVQLGDTPQPFRVFVHTSGEPSDRVILADYTSPGGNCQIELEGRMVLAVLTRRTVEIEWGHCEACHFPVNISGESKPGLPSVLGTRPSEEQLLAYFQGRITEEDLLVRLAEPSQNRAAGTADPVDDSLRSRPLQNYVIRQFVESLWGMNQTLTAAAYSPRALEQALLGDLSPIALAMEAVRAYQFHRRSATATAFQLVELLRTVGELEIKSTAKEVRDRAVQRILGLAAATAADSAFYQVVSNDQFQAYVNSALTAPLAEQWRAKIARRASCESGGGL